MRRLKQVLIGLALLQLAPTTTCISLQESASSIFDKDEVRHANHIFNAIHSSMRQWGSSWNHNGMSFFLATVPAHAEFYFGSSFSSKPLKGIDWLAFEPEHSLAFAAAMFRCADPNDDGGPGQPGSPPPRPSTQRVNDNNAGSFHRGQAPFRTPEKGDEQPPLNPGHCEPGYLHTYRTKHALSLLYIDGMSGGKSRIGTLDTQDHVLLNWSSKGEPPDMHEEQRRAVELCALAEDKWNSRVDGFIRMELGFEIILCDFEKHTDFVGVTQTKNPEDVPRDSYIWDILFSWYRGIAARFDGIGYDRVTLNYDDFVTAYNYDIDMFPNGTGSMPRLRHLSVSDLDPIRRDVDRLVSSYKLPYAPHSESTNWQAIADAVVTRYSTAIPFFASLTNLTTLQAHIEMLMRPFIDFSDLNLTTEIDRCTKHFLPPSRPAALASTLESSSTASKALTTVSHHICSTLLTTLYLPHNDTKSQTLAQASLHNLTRYLDWPVWRHCSETCAYDEVCFIPIWPVGTVTDREAGRGRCIDASDMHSNRGESYWNKPGERPGPGGGHGPGGRPGHGPGGRPPPFPPPGAGHGEV